MASRRIFGPWLLALGVVGTVCLTWELGFRPLENHDEGVHAAVSLEMVRSGDWCSPTLAGEPYFRKPPLKIWITSLLFRVMGANLVAVRLPSAIAGVLLGLLVGIWMMQWRGKPLLAFITGAAVTCMRPVHFHAFRTGEMDGLLALFVTMTFYSWWRATEAGDASRRWILAAGVSLGLGFMTKALAALLPVPVICAHLLLLGRERRDRLSLLGGALAFLAIAAPWHVIMTIRHGAAFWDRYLGVEVVDRVLVAEWGAPKPMTWYVEHVPLFFFPWSVALAPALLWCLVRSLRERSSANTTEEPADGPIAWLLLLWFLMGFAVISLMKTKAQAYTLTLWPAALMLIISFLDRARPFAGDRLASWCYGAVVFCGAAWAPKALASEKAWSCLSAGPYGSLVTPLLGAAGVLLFGLLVTRFRSISRGIGMALAIALFTASVAVHFVECRVVRPASPLVGLIGEIRRRPCRVVCYRTRFLYQQAGWFHLLAEPGIDAVITDEEESLARMLESPNAYLLTAAGEALPNEVTSALELVAARDGYGLWTRR